jgi:hypothetical protein
MHVHDLVTSANTLAIGVDPVHHYAYVHFGTGTGIRHGDYIPIERAGNAEFHAGHWGAGVRAIVNAASAASSQSQRSEVIIQQPTTVVEHGASIWPYFLFGGLLAATVLLVWRWMRRRTVAIENAAQEARDEAQEMRKRNIEEQGWHDKMSQKMGQSEPGAAASQAQPVAQIRAVPQAWGPTEVDREMQAAYRGTRYQPSQPYVQPAAAPVIIATQPAMYGGNNDFLTGMLVADALERPREREVVREVVHETRHESSSGWGGSSSDSGGGGSSWDSGSSSDSGGGGGFDSGGGDSGGGFDSGGGGGDF